MLRLNLLVWSLLVLMVPYHLVGVVGESDSLYSVKLHPNDRLYPVSMPFNCAAKPKKRQVSKSVDKKKRTNPESATKEAINRKNLLQKEPIWTQRAWLYSAIIPGLGQAYNRKYWKTLMFYGGFALGFGLAIFHHQEYRVSERELIGLWKQGTYNRHLINYVETQKRERNMYLFFTGIWYLINIFDAYVDGTLKTFDVSDNLEIIFAPSTASGSNQAPSLGMDISLNLKA